jgi:hypothetical protein
MSRRIISLKARVRYEGRAKMFDRRATVGADLDKLPDPIWPMASQSGKLPKFADLVFKRKK